MGLACLSAKERDVLLLFAWASLGYSGQCSISRSERFVPGSTVRGPGCGRNWNVPGSGGGAYGERVGLTEAVPRRHAGDHPSGDGPGSVAGDEGDPRAWRPATESVPPSAGTGRVDRTWRQRRRHGRAIGCSHCGGRLPSIGTPPGPVCVPVGQVPDQCGRPGHRDVDGRRRVPAREDPLPWVPRRPDHESRCL